MTIDKAIEILTIINKPGPWEIFPDDIDAIKLGIEALKVCRDLRQEFSRISPAPLPGEDSE